MDTIKIAEVAHEVNKAYCKSIGDDSQPTWDDAPEWQKSSAVAGVNFHYENSEATPEDSHKSWLKEKEKDGWVYGEVKDPDKKMHPCMVEYNELPAQQQAKDALYVAVVRTLLK